MLIAIMGDTYERVVEISDLSRIKMKLNLMSEQKYVFWCDTKRDPKYFMYYVTPDEEEDVDLGSWEGTIKKMTSFYEKTMTQIRSDISSKIVELQDHVDQNAKQDVVQDRDLKRQVYDMITMSNRKTERKFDEQREMIQEQREMI